MDRFVSIVRNHYSDLRHLDVSIETVPVDAKLAAYLKHEISGSSFSLAEAQTFLEQVRWKTLIMLRNVHICLLHRDSDPSTEVPMALLKRVIKRACCIMAVCKSNLSIQYWFLPTYHCKEFPTLQTENVSPRHVNSAYTYHMTGKIFIYRREEFPKVMLHELIHNMDLDTFGEWKQEHLHRVFAKFNIDPKTILRPNEGIVETWANLFQLTFIHLEQGWPLEKMLHDEQTWSLQLTKWILRRQKKHAWVEDTHAYSYHVLRCIFLQSPNLFISVASGKKIPEIVNVLERTADSKGWHDKLRHAKLPGTSCFRMTIYGDV
jgi:hypothetical protein